jgi:hypothetical protein
MIRGFLTGPCVAPVVGGLAIAPHPHPSSHSSTGSAPSAIATRSKPAAFACSAARQVSRRPLG